MKKGFLLLSGLLLIALLTYFCFSTKQESIRQNLIANTQNALGNQGSSIKVGIKGSGFEATRIVTLNGVVSSKEQKDKLGELAKSAQGVAGVENLLKVQKPKPKPAPVPIPSPYTISASKSKDGEVVLNGYVSDAGMHQKLLSDAKELFGGSVRDNLKEAKGAPAAWLEVCELGLSKLKDVNYGEFNISDSEFTFKGYVNSNEAKSAVLSAFENSLNSAYKGEYEIDAPEAKAVVAESNSSADLNQSAAEDNASAANEQAAEDNASAADSNVSIENQVKSCESQIDNLLAKEKIHFEYNKAVIKPDSYDLLAQLVDIINNCPNAIVTIEGYTDSDGSAKYNRQLSQKRADAVKNYLINKGVAKERLKAVGFGEDNPVASNATKEGKGKNRRIEFKFEGVK